MSFLVSRVTCPQRRHMFRIMTSFAAILCLAASARAQVGTPPAEVLQTPIEAPAGPGAPLLYVIQGKPVISTLYFDGRQVELQTEQRWRFMCGSDLTGLTLDDLKRCAHENIAAFENGPAFIVDDPDRAGGIDIVFNAGGSVPAGALDGLAQAEAYIESLFSNQITVTINVSFGATGGALGATASSYAGGVTYADSRNGLQAGMDADDVIQAWLPTGNTVPVRYDGNTSTVTNENQINWTVANYRATIGSFSALAASMTFNDNANWDYDPSDGVPFNKYSFVDVAIHETGHALGFVSEADTPGNAMDALDLFRFQRSDGSGDYNPDTYAEFQTTARMVDYNAPLTDDDANTDLIAIEPRMSDGDPYQASHWRERSGTSRIGLMDPAFGAGEEHYPDFYTSNDTAAFDAIGYIYPPCEVPGFTTQPAASQTVCDGDTVFLSVAVDIGSPAYQWRIGTNNLTDDGSHIIGATTDTLSIIGVTVADEADSYNCLVTNTLDECKSVSDNAEIIVEDIVFTQQPQDFDATEGGVAIFSVSVIDPLHVMTYQWRKDGSPLSDDSRITGTTTNQMWIDPVKLGDAGQYDVVVTSTIGAQCSEASDAATLTVSAGDGCPQPGASGNYCLADIYPNNGDGSWNYADDGDCVLDISDLGQLLTSYGMTSGATREDGDVYPPEVGDGAVDISDLGELLTQYGDDCN